MPYPWREEQAHTMSIGSTGMGKTVAMMDQSGGGTGFSPDPRVPVEEGATPALRPKSRSAG